MWLFKKQFFNQDEEKHIMKAIRQAEKESSGEVRLYVESHCKIPAAERAMAMFKKLKMHRTTERNGVLIYIAMMDKHFAIFGDEGIHQKMGFSFWTKEAETLKAHLSKGEIVEGICEAIQDIGQVLKEHFPPNDDDKNELSDKPVYGR